MFGVEELKESIEITKTTIECPAKGCSKEVKRKYRKDTHEYTPEFKCKTHNVFISPSTFVYTNELDNLLWKDQSDRELFKGIKASKKGNSRFEHDNSEDAVSWNVFRFLEKNNLTEGFLGSITDTSPRSSEVIYWSHSQVEDKSWSLLNSARTEFEVKKSWFSEPDIIIKTDDALFFIEAKFTAPTKDSERERELKNYTTGGENWFSEVFSSDFQTVAVDNRLYEMMRFWLLGTWMAKQQDLDFYLINLVLSKKEKDIETIFGRHIKKTQRRKFLRVTWEAIYDFILKSRPSSEKDIMLRYFRNKTKGYDGKSPLAMRKKAFSIL